MNKQFWKLYLFFIGIILFVGCLVFLIMNHHDSLDKYVPDQAETYLHINVNKAKRLEPNKQDHLLNWLEAKSSLTKDEWQGILNNSKNELGLFSINGQIFALVKENKSLASYLNSSKVSSESLDNIVYIPKLNLETFDKFITDQIWYRALKKKVTFSDFTIYSKDLSKLETSVPLLRTSGLYPIAAFGKIHNDKITLDIIGNVGQGKTTLRDENLKEIPGNAQLYFRNIDSSTLQLLKVPGEDLTFSILNLINGKIEFVKTTSGSVIYAPKESNDLENLKMAIKQTVAMLYPVEKEVELPDGTTGIHLIADPSIDQYFAESNGEWGTLAETDESLIRFNLIIKETQNNYIITLDAPNLGSKIDSECSFPKFTKSSGLYLNSGQGGWENILIQNKKQTKLSICID